MSQNRGATFVMALTLAIGIASLCGCGVIRAAHKIENAIEGNKHLVDAFTNNLKSGSPTSFEATYSTTGSSPSTVVYAVQPPDDVAFTDSESNSGGTDSDFVTNGSGPYFCTRPDSGAATWSCDKGAGASTAQEQAIVDLYTPAHWVTFLDDFSLAAGFAGDKISSSTMSVNGFSMDCIDFVASGVPGTSTICSTSQHLLGYVRVASSSTSFEITGFSASPPSSLFTIPAGATITTVQLPTSTSSP